MEQRFSNKIYWFSYALSILVVWVHSFNTEILFPGHERSTAALASFERFFSETLGQAAVPGFFVMSGFLFFRTCKKQGILSKWKKRIQTLLVPYLLWNTIYYTAYLIAERIPFVQQVKGSFGIRLDWPTAVSAILFYHYNPVFWYMFQLILLVMLAPVLLLCLSRVSVTAVTLAVLLFAIYEGLDLPLLNEDALFYYFMGAVVVTYAEEWVAYRKKRLDLFWVAVTGCVLVTIYGWSRQNMEQGAAWGIHATVLTTVLVRFFMVCLIWKGLDWIPMNKVPCIMRETFFLYAIHFGIIKFVNLIFEHSMTMWEYQNQILAAGILFMLMPAICTLLCWISAAGIRKIAPKPWALLVGGR